MKRITFIILLIFGMNHAQFFESDVPEQQQENFQFFNSNAPTPAEQVTDERPDLGNPGENQVPIDNWLLLLPMAGIAIGVYWLRKKSKLTA